MLSSLKCNFQGVKETKEETVKQRFSTNVKDKRVDSIFEQHRSIREKERAIVAAKEAGKKRPILLYHTHKILIINETLNMSVSIQERAESTTSDTNPVLS